MNYLDFVDAFGSGCQVRNAPFNTPNPSDIPKGFGILAAKSTKRARGGRTLEIIGRLEGGAAGPAGDKDREKRANLEETENIECTVGVWTAF